MAATIASAPRAHARRARKATRGASGPRAQAQRQTVGARVAAPDPALADLPPEAQARFERLRALRREIAHEEEVPAYIVFDDKTLRRIAVNTPRTLAAFGEVHGVGPVKTERFGPRFIAALAELET